MARRFAANTISTNTLRKDVSALFKRLNPFVVVLVNCYLPDKRYVRLAFLQDILADNKLVLHKDQVNMHTFNQNYHEYSVKNVWPLVKTASELHEYLPLIEMSKGKFPDKKWFMGLCFTLIP